MNYDKNDFKKDFEIASKRVAKDNTNGFTQGYLQALKNYKNFILFGVDGYTKNNTKQLSDKENTIHAEKQEGLNVNGKKEAFGLTLRIKNGRKYKV
jgi:hypothetical protein